MKTPSVNTANARLLTLDTYLVARLKADPKAKALAPTTAGPRARLEQAEQGQKLAEEAAAVAQALRDAADAEADDAVRRLYRRLQLLALDGDDDALLRRYFSAGASRVVHQPVGRQVAEMRVLAGRLATETNAEVAAYQALISDAADTLQQRQAAFKAAQNAVQVAFGAVLEARAEWIRTYEKVFGELVALFGKKRANGFFKRRAAAKKKKTGTSEAEPVQ